MLNKVKEANKAILYKLIAFMCFIVVPFISMVSIAEAVESKTIRVGWYESTKFQEGMSDEKPKTGYSYEYLQRVADYTDWKYEYVYGGWSDLYDKFLKGEIDVMAGVSETLERRNYMLFPKYPMGMDTYYLFQNLDRQSMKLADKSTFTGKKIGTIKNNRMTVYLEKWAKDNQVDIEVIQYDNFQQMADGFKSHNLDGLTGTNTNIMLNTRYVPVTELGEEPFYLAVSKTRPDILEELNRVLGIIDRTTPELLRALQREAYGASFANNSLNAEEEEWVKRHRTLKVGYLKDYLPFCGIDEQGNPTGIVTSVIDQILVKLQLKNRLNVQYKAYDSFIDMNNAVNKGEVDVSFSVIGERNILNEMKINASSEILTVPFSVAYVGDYSEKTLDVMAFRARPIKKIKDMYPNSKVHKVASDKEALEAVQQGRASCTIMASYRLNYLLNDPQFRDIKVMPLSTSCNYCLGIDKSQKALLSLIDKGVFLVDKAIITDQLFKYIQGGKKYTLGDFAKDNLVTVTVLALLIFGGIIIAMFMHSRSIAKAKQKTEEQLEQIKSLNLQLQEARSTAEQASNAKTVFLSNMSHDIRTPMNAILGFAALIEKDIDKPELLKGHLKKLQSSGKYLLTLINDVLDMSRIDSGKVTIEETVVDVEDIIYNIRSVFEDEMKTKRISVEQNFDFKHRYIYADFTKVQEVAVNIISNAVKYTPAGGRIAINLQEKECSRDGYGAYVFTVSDSGIGMSEDFQKHIFEAFTRERNTTQSKVIGTGLGMAIVKKLVELMGGNVTVKSELGKGSTFQVYIEHRLAEATQKEASKQKTDDIAIALQGKRALLAEDNDLNAEIACAILEAEGLQVDRAIDGNHCVQLLQDAESDYYDFVLMDVQMPNLNGYQATQQIRQLGDKHKSSIPIIAMTANAFEEDRKQALEAGMNGFCPKPIAIESLFKEIWRVLQNS